MKLNYVKYLGFDGVRDAPIVLDPAVSAVVGAAGSGKSRLLALLEATAGELSGRPMARGFLRGPRAKITLRWEVPGGPGEPATEGETELFIGDQSARPATVERDLGQQLARARGLAPRVHDALDGQLGEPFCQALVDHQLGVEHSQQAERFIAALGQVTTVRLSLPRRDGRLLVPAFSTRAGERSFSKLPRSSRSMLALLAAVSLGEPLVLIDDVHLLEAPVLDSILAARHPDSQLVLTSRRELHSPVFTHSLD